MCPINGLRGSLLRDSDGKFIFRLLFDNEEGFIDADIWHNDLEITLHGEGQLVFRADGTAYIDHSPEVLGET